MDVKRWGKLQENFDNLADMKPEQQVSALRALSEKDPDMATEVRELLEEDAYGRQLPDINVESLLQEALHQSEAIWPDEGQIGPYRILKLLGEGGMGVVYLAERTDIAGHVAIKLLRDAWLSPLRRERFAIEQQMLGLLKHPSIARIYDAGTTKDGTPWFVMEYSDGVPITEYFVGRNPTGREILKLVGSVCETVRYAHSLAIIHRDLKPSNILIGDEGQIKLLDFGIAKQMDMVNRGSIATTAGFRLFTPAYAAPELQSENEVGVFTDIYSMGVILYQLLTGRTPFLEGGLGERAPQRPSKIRLSADPENQLALSKSEWADVDAICLKALAREVENRYGSMDALIADIDAFLKDRPLAARKNAVVYTTKKFLYRNRVAALSVAVGLLLVLAGTVLFTVRLARARDVASAARDQAVAEAARSARLQGFTESLFSGNQAYGDPPPGIKVTQMLDRGRAEALQMNGDPRLQAAMYQVLGTAYLNLGDFAKAESLLLIAKNEICSEERSNQCAETERRLGLAISLHGSMEDSRTLMDDALHIKQEKLAADDPTIASLIADIGTLDVARGDWAKARLEYGQALSIASVSGKPTPQLASVLGNFAIIAVPVSDPRALQYEAQSAQINMQLYGINSFEHAANERGFGEVYLELGDYKKSEQHFRSALTEVRAWAGNDELIAVSAMDNLAGTLIMERKFNEAEDLLHQALEIILRNEIPPTVAEGEAYFYLGFIELQREHLKAAEELFDSVVAIAHRHAAVEEMFVEYSELSLAHIYSKRGDERDAESVIRNVLNTTKLKPSYVIVSGYALLGHVLLREGKLAEAEDALKLAFAWFSHDAIRPHTAMTYKDFAEVENRLGRHKQASAILAELHFRHV